MFPSYISRELDVPISDRVRTGDRPRWVPAVEPFAELGEGVPQASISHDILGDAPDTP